MDKKDNGLKAMSNKITDRCNKFAFLVFKKCKEETGSWLERDDGTQRRTDIKDIHDRACEIKDEIQHEHDLHDDQVGKYEGQVPTICVSVTRDSVHIRSEDWFCVTVGKVGSEAINLEHMHYKIKECFERFGMMVRCQLAHEIANAPPDMVKAFLRDKQLVDVKTDFELKMWIKRTVDKTDSNGMPNPDHIPGMDVLARRGLAVVGLYEQVRVTKTLHEGGVVKVLGVENQPHCDETKKKCDVDIWLECDGKEIPVQVGVREGELAMRVSDATACLWEGIKPNEAVSKFGGTNMDYGKEQDFDALRKKLGQIPPDGIVLWRSSEEWLPGSGPRPVKEWYGDMMDKKCVIVWVRDGGEAVIHHNNTGFDLALAKKLCIALGVTEPSIRTDSDDSLTEDDAQMM